MLLEKSRGHHSEGEECFSVERQNGGFGLLKGGSDPWRFSGWGGE